MIGCARCGRDARVNPDDLLGDGGGDPSLLVIVAPPEGWLGDPDGDGVICSGCATAEEATGFGNLLIAAERMLRGDPGTQ